jgi:hypothetical protein
MQKAGEMRCRRNTYQPRSLPLRDLYIAPKSATDPKRSPMKIDQGNIGARAPFDYEAQCRGYAAA